jgi:hypothetical protein
MAIQTINIATKSHAISRHGLLGNAYDSDASLLKEFNPKQDSSNNYYMMTLSSSSDSISGALIYRPAVMLLKTNTGLSFHTLESYNSSSLSNINAINALRSGDNVPDIEITSYPGIEKIRVSHGMTGMINDAERRLSVGEVSRKVSMINFFASMYDMSYSPSVYKAAQQTSISIPSNGIIGLYPAIAIRSAPATIMANVIIRGIPFPMKRTITSYNGDGTINGIFMYSDYILNSYAEIMKSMQYIELKNFGKASLYSGSSDSFAITNTNYGSASLAAFNLLY